MFCDRVVEELGLICAAVDLLRDDNAVLTAVLAGRVHQGVRHLCRIDGRVAPPP